LFLWLVDCRLARLLLTSVCFLSSGRRLKVQQHGSIGSAGLRVVANISILV
jgi:hypothetical protein